jgi:hypothetical protein
MADHYEQLKEAHKREIVNKKEANAVILAMQDARHVIKVIDVHEPATFERRVLIAQMILQLSENKKTNA